jgi:predicted aspartyl protease
MNILSFERELGYGDTHTISVPVRLQNLPYLVDAILDTGAAVSSFDRALLPDLGISEVRSGTEIEVRAANDERALAYIHTVRVEVLGHVLMIPVAFCPDWPEGTRNLLGMRGFFEQALIAFEHQYRKIHYTITGPSVWPL